MTKQTRFEKIWKSLRKAKQQQLDMIEEEGIILTKPPLAALKTKKVEILKENSNEMDALCNKMHKASIVKRRQVVIVDTVEIIEPSKVLKKKK